MMGKLRSNPGTKGYISGNGMYLSKHSAGVYSTIPNERLFESTGGKTEIRPKRKGPVMAREAEGKGTIETYTVIHDRENAPVRSIIIGRLEDRRRFIAHTIEDRAFLEGLMKVEAIGRTGKVRNKDGLNIFHLD
jgi:acetyl-CoA C-acetyltransferase